MQKTVYLNFSDLNEDTQNYIMHIAESNIREDEAQMQDIEDMYPDRIDEVVTERAERELYSMNFIFNV